MKEPIEVKDIKEGDTIEATKGVRCVRDVIERGSGPVFSTGLYLGNPALFGLSLITSYVESGYSFFILDRPKPPVVLPTEDGSVISWKEDNAAGKNVTVFAERVNEDEWRVNGFDLCDERMLLVNARGSLLTRLAPVAETAAKMRDAILAEPSWADAIAISSIEKVAAEFGATDE